MNFSEIKSAVSHLKKTTKCGHCDQKYKDADISVIASTQKEALFEMRCPKCDGSSIVTVFQTTNEETVEELEVQYREHHKIEDKISENDVLDIKNFLTKFDGNFKKIFTKEQ